MTCEPEFANHLSKLSSLWDIAIVSYEYPGVKILRLITHFLTYILYIDTYSWEVKYICQRPYFYTRQYLYLIFFSQWLPPSSVLQTLWTSSFKNSY